MVQLSPSQNPQNQMLNSHLQCRSSQLGPLFCHINAKPLTSFQFSSILQKCLKFLQVDTKTFKSHSFRIGAATHLYLAGIPESQIQNRGLWQSNAYKHYLRPELVWLGQQIVTEGYYIYNVPHLSFRIHLDCWVFHSKEGQRTYLPRSWI